MSQKPTKEVQRELLKRRIVDVLRHLPEQTRNEYFELTRRLVSSIDGKYFTTPRLVAALMRSGRTYNSIIKKLTSRDNPPRKKRYRGSYTRKQSSKRPHLSQKFVSMNTEKAPSILVLKRKGLPSPRQEAFDAQLMRAHGKERPADRFISADSVTPASPTTTGTPTVRLPMTPSQPGVVRKARRRMVLNDQEKAGPDNRLAVYECLRQRKRGHGLRYSTDSTAESSIEDESSVKRKEEIVTFKITPRLIADHQGLKRSRSQRQIMGLSASQYFQICARNSQGKVQYYGERDAEGKIELQPMHWAHRQAHSLGGAAIAANLDASTAGSNYELLALLEIHLKNFEFWPYLQKREICGDERVVTIKAKFLVDEITGPSGEVYRLPFKNYYQVSWGKGRSFCLELNPRREDYPSEAMNVLSKHVIRHVRSPQKASPESCVDGCDEEMTDVKHKAPCYI